VLAVCDWVVLEPALYSISSSWGTKLELEVLSLHISFLDRYFSLVCRGLAVSAMRGWLVRLGPWPIDLLSVRHRVIFQRIRL